jgi:hypothetical protein
MRLTVGKDMPNFAAAPDKLRSSSTVTKTRIACIRSMTT